MKKGKQQTEGEEENRSQPGRADAATGTSWFSPENVADIGQDTVMSISFPPGQIITRVIVGRTVGYYEGK
jgi:hypothetical protein